MKKTKRTKRVSSVTAPTNLHELNQLLSELGAADRLLAKEKARLETLFERIRARSAEGMREVVLKRGDIAKAITAYAKAHRIEILPPDRKSLELASGTIGWRFGPWKVVASQEEASIITWLKTNGFTEYLRYSVELNREELIANKPDSIPGIRFEQKEHFFMEPKEEVSREVQSSVVSFIRVA